METDPRQEELRSVHDNLQIQVDEEALLVENFAHISSTESDEAPEDLDSDKPAASTYAVSEEHGPSSTLAVQFFLGVASTQPSSLSTAARHHAQPAGERSLRDAHTQKIFFKPLFAVDRAVNKPSYHTQGVKRFGVS